MTRNHESRRRSGSAGSDAKPLVSVRWVELFCAVAEAQSFTSAARRLGLTPAAISRAIAKQEAALGAVLFRRTTRSMHLTDEGRGYFERCREALALLEGAERALVDGDDALRGVVRVSAPTTYGPFRLAPFVAGFVERHPDVDVDLRLENRNVDFVTDGCDLAIRMGELADSSLLARRLEEASVGVFASAAYLARRGKPRTADDLERHALLGFVRPSTGRVLPWIFREKDGAPFEITPTVRLRCSGDPLANIALARAGAGLVQCFRFLVERDLAAGDLVEVLPKFAHRTRPFTLLQPPSARAPRRAVRRFADELVAWAASLAPTSGKPVRRAR